MPNYGQQRFGGYGGGQFRSYGGPKKDSFGLGQAKGAAFNKAVDAMIAYFNLNKPAKVAKEDMVALVRWFFEAFKPINLEDMNQEAMPTIPATARPKSPTEVKEEMVTIKSPIVHGAD